MRILLVSVSVITNTLISYICIKNNNEAER